MFKNANWLKKNINNKNLKILDASWYLPNSKRNSLKEYNKEKIPKASFFDIDKICDRSSPYPHMVPSKFFFEKEVSKLGINKNHTIIVYCKEGITSSPRAWWLFKYFGHKNIYVLNGGYKAWKLIKGKIKKRNYFRNKREYYKCGRICNTHLIKYKSLLIKHKEDDNIIIDARPRNRYLGIENEPRPNIGKGKILNSINLPFCLFDRNGYIKSKKTLRDLISNKVIRKKLIICSCGSGVSACTIAISLTFIGIHNWCVYDGSWTEWYLKTTD